MSEEHITGASMDALAEVLAKTNGTERTVLVINRTEEACSIQFRLSGPGTEVKLYGKDPAHLLERVQEIANSEDLALALRTIKERYQASKN